MNKDRRFFISLFYIAAGLVLFALGCMEIVDSFWGSMGSALAAVSAVRAVKMYRLGKNSEYREKMETAASDERNHFIRNKAWAWAGYLYVIIAGIAVIVLKIAGHDLVVTTIGFTVCLIITLYWISFMILSKRY